MGLGGLWDKAKGFLPGLDSDEEKRQKMEALYNSGAQFPTQDQVGMKLDFGPGAKTGTPAYTPLASHGLNPGGSDSGYKSAAADALIQPMSGMDIAGMQAPAGLSAVAPMFKANQLDIGSALSAGGDTTPTKAPETDGGLSGWQKGALLAQILGTGAGVYGQYKEGQARDEEMRRQQEEHDRILRERDESAKRLSPILARYLKVPGTQME